jgi:hypothetical protein
MSTVRKRRRTKPMEDRPPYWMQEWLAYHEKSGRIDGREYRIYDVHASKVPPLSSACAEGVISRISDTALELREPESLVSAYVFWFGMLMAAPLLAVPFYADIPQTIWGTLGGLWLVGAALCAAAFCTSSVFMTFKKLLRPSPLNVGILCDRRNQRLWWRDGGEDRWVMWDRIRVAHRKGCPTTQTSEDLRLLVLDKNDALVTTLERSH